MRSRTAIGAAATAAVLATGLTALAVGQTGAAGAKPGFTPTPEQLRINQKISSAAVRRANANRKAIEELKALPSQTPGAVGPTGAQGPPGPRGPAGEAPAAGEGTDTQTAQVRSAYLTLADGASGTESLEVPGLGALKADECDASGQSMTVSWTNTGTDAQSVGASFGIPLTNVLAGAKTDIAVDLSSGPQPFLVSIRSDAGTMTSVFGFSALSGSTCILQAQAFTGS